MWLIGQLSGASNLLIMAVLEDFVNVYPSAAQGHAHAHQRQLDGGGRLYKCLTGTGGLETIYLQNLRAKKYACAK